MKYSKITIYNFYAKVFQYSSITIKIFSYTISNRGLSQRTDVIILNIMETIIALYKFEMKTRDESVAARLKWIPTRDISRAYNPIS